MARDREQASTRRLTLLVLGIVVLIAVISVGLLAGLGGGDGDDSREASTDGTRSEQTKPTTTTSTRPKTAFNYTIARGDTLTALGHFFGVSANEIAAANPNLNPDALVEGQVIVIPPPPKQSLVVKPARPKVGGSVDIILKGARVGEFVTFQIDRPTGPFFGSPHVGGQDGRIETSYSLGLPDPPGVYTVTARGDQGTTLQATFEVVAKKSG